MKKLPIPPVGGMKKEKIKKKKSVIFDQAAPTAPIPPPTNPSQIFPPSEPIVPAVNPSVVEPTGAGLGAKEREILQRNDEIQLEEIRKELELAPEVKEAGVEVKSEEIELPPPLPKMGVIPVGISQPVQPPPGANVPLPDETIVNNTGGSIWASLTWLAQWCLKQLKKVHVQIKKVHGRIVRIITK